MIPAEDELIQRVSKLALRRVELTNNLDKLRMQVLMEETFVQELENIHTLYSERLSAAKTAKRLVLDRISKLDEFDNNVVEISKSNPGDNKETGLSKGECEDAVIQSKFPTEGSNHKGEVSEHPNDEKVVLQTLKTVSSGNLSSRLMRKLGNRSIASRLESIRPEKDLLSGNRPFEDFMIVGSDLQFLQTNISLMTSDSPRILFQFPSCNPRDYRTERIPFIFPEEKVEFQILRPSDSQSELQELLYDSKGSKSRLSCHTFILKDTNDDVDLFGITMSVKEVLSVVSIHEEVEVERKMVTENFQTDEDTVQNVVVPVKYCLISRYPIFGFLFEILDRLISMVRFARLEALTSKNMNPLDAQSKRTLNGIDFILNPFVTCDGHCTPVLKAIYSMRIPPQGQDRLKVAFPMDLPTIDLDVKNMSSSVAIGDWALPSALSSISADQLVLLLDIVLREYKVVVCCPELNMTTSVVFALSILIRPLRWAGALLPMLPKNLESFIEAPVPLLAGLARLPSTYSTSSAIDEDTAVWFPSENILWPPRSLKGKMPFSNDLSSKLRTRLLAMQGPAETQWIIKPTPAQKLAAENIQGLIRGHIIQILKLADQFDQRMDEANSHKKSRLKSFTQFFTMFCATQMRSCRSYRM